MQAAILPQRILVARHPERRCHPDVALEHFRVIADLFDDVVGPVIAKTETRAEVARSSEQETDRIAKERKERVVVGKKRKR